MNTSLPLLEVQNLSHVYPSGVQALQKVEFQVQKGEFLVVIGLSGSGKSTLLRCLNRLITPTSGQIQFQGHDTTHLRGKDLRQLRRDIAMIFQHFDLVPRLSVVQNILLGRLSQTSTLNSLFRRFSAEDVQLSTELVKRVGLEEQIDQRADQLSGGQQQRVMIARALAQQPQVLLADEPVASLDPATSHLILDHLKRINVELGLTVICNLHFLSLVRTYATRVIALKDGKIVYRGHPKDINQEWFKEIYGQEARDVQIN